MGEDTRVQKMSYCEARASWAASRELIRKTAKELKCARKAERVARKVYEKVEATETFIV